MNGESKKTDEAKASGETLKGILRSYLAIYLIFAIIAFLIGTCSMGSGLAF